jgi:hypothetical protein
MDHFSRDDLRALLANRQTPCVSLFLHTTRGPAHQDNKGWKNLLQEAEERLAAGGQRSLQAKALLAPAHELLNDAPFWLNVSSGLAGFLSPEMARFYRLPAAFRDQAVCNDHFHVKPVLPLLTGDGRFYLLALSQKSVRFLQGSRDTVQELGLPGGVPTSLEDALGYGDELAHDRQFVSQTVHSHPAAGGPAGAREAIFQGKGPGVDSAKDGLAEFCKQVDHGLNRFWHNEQAPLVLAADTALQPIYRGANTYAHLLAEGIKGSPERLSPKELHAAAWDLVQPHFEQEQEKIAARYRDLVGARRGHTANDLREVLPTAHEGHVQYLFVAQNQERWGRFEPANRAVVPHERAEPGDDDLLNLAVVYALSHKAVVWVVEQEKMPDKSPVAAIYWYGPGQRSGKPSVTAAP